MDDLRLAVVCSKEDKRFHRRAETLASELALPLAQNGSQDWCVRDAPYGSSAYDFLLCVGDRGIELRDTLTADGSPIRVDFVTGSTAYRRQSANQRQQLIARAIGLQKGTSTILDATAGLGRDAFLFACLGCRVTAVERSPILATMLRDGLDRAAESTLTGLKTIIERISLVQGDACNVLQSLPMDARPDVVYIDPMYPPSDKSALAKKEMRMCRRLVGDDDDAAALLAVARNIARRRVVVKRHRHAPPLAPDASVTYKGTTVRYDAYIRVRRC